jgi:hypothetical protein
MQLLRKIGKTKITLDKKGCTDCGTEHSSGWHHIDTILVESGKTRRFIEIPVCADCMKIRRNHDGKKN